MGGGREAKAKSRRTRVSGAGGGGAMVKWQILVRKSAGASIRDESRLSAPRAPSRKRLYQLSPLSSISLPLRRTLSTSLSLSLLRAAAATTRSESGSPYTHFAVTAPILCECWTTAETVYISLSCWLVSLSLSLSPVYTLDFALATVVAYADQIRALYIQGKLFFFLF